MNSYTSVPFLDLGAAYLELKEEIEATIQEVLRSGRYVGGPIVADFEEKYAIATGAAHCIGVGNGLDALHLTLTALGIGPGDEVLVPSNTFIATWLAVSHCGATPIPVEPDPITYTIDPSKLEMAISSRTRAIIPVHLYGHPADLDPIMVVARKHGLAVVEDGAQAHGALYKGRPIGSHGNPVAWSFYPGKNLGALGDGGAVTTDDPVLQDRIRELGNYGSRQKYVHELIGFNSRLDPVQAAVLRVKLAYMEDWNERRRRLAQRYKEALATTPLTLPAVAPWANPVWHLFVIRHSHRDDLQRYLTELGIGTLIHYPLPPHKQKAYRHLYGTKDLPIAESASNQVLSLPIWPQLSTYQQDYIIYCITEFYKKQIIKY